MSEEDVSLAAVLGACLKDLDRADDRRQRALELVRRIGDELALSRFLAHPLRHDQTVVAREAIMTSVDDRGRRIGKNEVLFRDVNERLRELGEGFSLITEEAEFICECGSGACTGQVRMSLSTYEEIRSDPKRFFVLKGHEEPEFEKVLSEREGYLVVEKLPGGPAGVAIRDDPRS